MINTTGNDNHISRYDFNSNPLVILIPHIKITGPFNNKTNLLICVQMLLEETFQFFFVIWKTLFWASDFILIGISPFLFDGIQYSIRCVGLYIELRKQTAYLQVICDKNVTLKYSTPVIWYNSSRFKNCGGLRWCSSLWSVGSSSMYQARTIFSKFRWDRLNIKLFKTARGSRQFNKFCSIYNCVINISCCPLLKRLFRLAHHQAEKNHRTQKFSTFTIIDSLCYYYAY